MMGYPDARTIRPDGSLDPAADFADDGASFRVRREAQLREQYKPADRWSWRYLFSQPRSYGEAVAHPLKMALKLFGLLFLFVMGAVGAIALVLIIRALG